MSVWGDKPNEAKTFARPRDATKPGKKPLTIEQVASREATKEMAKEGAFVVLFVAAMLAVLVVWFGGGYFIGHWLGTLWGWVWVVGIPVGIWLFAKIEEEWDLRREMWLANNAPEEASDD